MKGPNTIGNPRCILVEWTSQKINGLSAAVISVLFGFIWGITRCCDRRVLND
jgi:hypothetical protein